MSINTSQRESEMVGSDASAEAFYELGVKARAGAEALSAARIPERASYELHLGDGRFLRLSGSFSDHHVEQLLGALHRLPRAQTGASTAAIGAGAEVANSAVRDASSEAIGSSAEAASNRAAFVASSAEALHNFAEILATHAGALAAATRPGFVGWPSPEAALRANAELSGAIGAAAEMVGDFRHAAAEAASPNLRHAAAEAASLRHTAPEADQPNVRHTAPEVPPTIR